MANHAKFCFTAEDIVYRTKNNPPLTNAPVCKYKKCDCFAYGQRHCACLTSMPSGDICPFYKTVEKFIEDFGEGTLK